MMMKTIPAMILLFTGLAACQPSMGAPELSVENASLRAPLPGQSTAVAYFDIVNLGGKDVLLGATSNISDRVEMHNHVHEDGIMRMRQVEQVDVPPKSTVSFKSGELHVMFFEAQMSEPVSLTLDFENHADITLILTPTNH